MTYKINSEPEYLVCALPVDIDDEASIVPDFYTELHNLLRKVDGINFKERAQLKNLLTKYRDVFSDNPGCIKDFEYEIKVTDSSSKIKIFYSIPVAYKSAVIKEINRLLDLGIIEYASSLYCNPVRVVDKKDNTVRLVLDRRALNKYIESDLEGPPLVDDIIQGHDGMRFFTCTNLTQGYYQIPFRKIVS